MHAAMRQMAKKKRYLNNAEMQIFFPVSEIFTSRYFIGAVV